MPSAPSVGPEREKATPIIGRARALRAVALDLIDSCVKQHGEDVAQSPNHRCAYLRAQEAIVRECEALEEVAVALALPEAREGEEEDFAAWYARVRDRCSDTLPETVDGLDPVMHGALLTAYYTHPPRSAPDARDSIDGLDLFTVKPDDLFTGKALLAAVDYASKLARAAAPALGEDGRDA